MAPRKTTTATKSVAKTKTQEPQTKKIDFQSLFSPNDYVTVRNGFHGRLVYESKHTHELFEWSEFGDEQEMSLSELKSAKSASKAFFINNWFIFDDDRVLDYLGVRRFYENSLDVEEFDSVFELPISAMKAKIDGLPDGQKYSLAIRAAEMVADGEIDSLKRIEALELSLGIQLRDMD